MSEENIIPAIETRYKGYRFRSRLEARWAVWFDTLSIEYQYEKEGYDIDGRWYLPDFFMPYKAGEPGWGFWVEIKPQGDLTQEQIALYDGLARITGHRTFVICGDPWPASYAVHVFQHHHGGKPATIPLLSGCVFYEQETIIDCSTIGSGCNYGLYKQGVTFPFVCTSAYEGVEKLGLLSEAFQTARAARFEHGETP
jgi:hypothetical protein